MVTTLCYDVGLSVLAYFVAELLGASNYVSLLAGTVVSGLRVLWVALRQRRVDPFALFLLTLFGAGLAVSFVAGDARIILAPAPRRAKRLTSWVRAVRDGFPPFLTPLFRHS